MTETYPHYNTLTTPKPTKISYRHNTPYNDYSLIEYAQSQSHNPNIFVHPNSAAAQLGLTQEEIREVLEDQERWMREEYMVEEQGMYAPTTTTQHQQDSTPPPTPLISHSELAPQAYSMPNGPIDDATSSSYDNGWLDPEHAPSVLYQPHPPSQSRGTCPHHLMTVHTTWRASTTTTL